MKHAVLYSPSMTTDHVAAARPFIQVHADTALQSEGQTTSSVIDWNRCND